ncbi:MAG: BTAD domain-containing putative transcriptional regulator [Caldilineaceae bacterium]
MLKLFFLGRPYIEIDGAEIELGRRKNLALLAYLALATEPRRREELTALLWPELDAYHAQTALRRDLSVLRNALGNGALVVHRDVVGLHSSDALWCDVLEFQQRLDTYRARNHSEPLAAPDTINLLMAAVQLYRDDFLRGFSLRDSLAFDEWQLAQSEALRHDLNVALDALVGMYAQQHNWDQAIVYAQRLLELDPLHEAAHYQLMQLYTQAGRSHAALQQFQRCKQVLAENLGVAPSADLVRLHERLYTSTLLNRRALPTEASPNQQAQETSLTSAGARQDDQEKQPAISSNFAPHNLPSGRLTFVGREDEFAQLAQLLAEPECRLVTVVGPGGSGKTRLVIEFARRQLAHYGDGVYFVPLVALRHVGLLAAAMLEGIGVPRSSDRTPEETLLAYLQPRRLLLILDNFEHLLAGTPLLQRMLERSPALKMLVTSRERLSLADEWLVPLAGLPYPPQPQGHSFAAQGAPLDSEPLGAEPLSTEPFAAIQLFYASVRRIQPALMLNRCLSSADEAAIAEICRLVEGLPLAIELAATWLPILSCADIAHELRQGLDILATTSPSFPERHRSMRVTLERSWQLANPTEQTALCKLALFQDGFLPPAAEAVAEADHSLLLALAEKSWLRRAAHGRLAMHELVRQFCVEKLQESALDQQAILARHSQYYGALLADHAAALQDGRQVAALQILVAEVENVRAGWAWATAACAAAVLNHYVESFYRVGMMRSWHVEMVELLVQTAAEICRSCCVQASEAEQTLQPAWRYLLARLWNRAASYALDLGQFDQVQALCSKSLTLLMATEPDSAGAGAWRQEVHFAQAIQGALYVQQKSHHAALALAESLLAELPATETSETMVLITITLAQSRFAMGEQVETIAQLTTLAAKLRAVGELWLRARVLIELVFFLRVKNEFALAVHYSEECLSLCRLLDDQQGIARCLADQGYTIIFGGQPGDAQACFTAMLRIGDELQHPVLRAEAFFGLGQWAYFAHDWAFARSALEESYAIYAGIANQAGMTLCHLWFGELALVQGNLPEAYPQFAYVLNQASDQGSIPVILLGLEGVAKTALHSGQLAADALVAALATLILIRTHPNTWEFARSRVNALLQELQDELPAEQFAAALAQSSTLALEEAIAWGQRLAQQQ